MSSNGSLDKCCKYTCITFVVILILLFLFFLLTVQSIISLVFSTKDYIKLQEYPLDVEVVKDDIIAYKNFSFYNILYSCMYIVLIPTEVLLEMYLIITYNEDKNKHKKRRFTYDSFMKILAFGSFCIFAFALITSYIMMMVHGTKLINSNNEFFEDLTLKDLENIESSFNCCFGIEGEGARNECMCDIKYEQINDEKFTCVSYNISHLIPRNEIEESSIDDSNDYLDDSDESDDDYSSDSSSVSNKKHDMDCGECTSYFKLSSTSKTLQDISFLLNLIHNFIIVFFMILVIGRVIKEIIDCNNNRFNLYEEEIEIIPFETFDEDDNNNLKNNW